MSDDPKEKKGGGSLWTSSPDSWEEVPLKEGVDLNALLAEDYPGLDLSNLRGKIIRIYPEKEEVSKEEKKEEKSLS